MTSVAAEGKTYSATYGNNGLLQTRTNPFRSFSIPSSGRDSLGRITEQQTTVGSVLALRETVPSWDGRNKAGGVYSERAGAWNENRDYAYDNSGRLISEDYVPRPGATEEALTFRYDGGAQGITGGIGVRTHMQRTSDSLVLHDVPAVADFARVESDSLGSQSREVPLNGLALGAQAVTLTLDGRSIGPVTHPGWADATGAWTATANLAPGAHLLSATATHPSGWVSPATTSAFTVQARTAETVTSAYDGMGNVTSRTWSGGKAQTLTWDARGRLVKVEQTGSSPFTWIALYDGLDRRIRTTYTPLGGSTATVKSTFDPEVEFLEIGVSVNGAQNWKIYGPDISGSYGGLQGTGGLEAVIGPDGITRGIVNDWFGNTVGWVDAPGAAVTWSPAQFLAWGPAPGWGTPMQDGTMALHQLLGYRGLTVDPPGTVQMGLRPYDADTGRWLSHDPVAGTASLSGYDYADNDPINNADPDGRFGKASSYQDQRLSVQRADNYRASYGPTYASSFKGYAGEGWNAMGERQQISQVMNFVPIIGQVKAASEAVSGYDLAGGRYLSQSEQIGSAASFALGMATAGGLGGSAGRAVIRTETRIASTSFKSVSSAAKGTSFSRVMSRDYYDAWKAGKAPIGGEETWITYTDDLAGISSSRGAAERLTLVDDVGNLRVNDYVRVDFSIDDMFRGGLRSPIETVPPRGYGFRHGGFTQGGARELLMNPDAPITIFREVPLAPWRY